MRIAKTLDDLPVGTQVHIYEHRFGEPKTRKGIVVENSTATEYELAGITILLSDTSLFGLEELDMDFIRRGGMDMEIRIVEIK